MVMVNDELALQVTSKENLLVEYEKLKRATRQIIINIGLLPRNECSRGVCA